MRIRLQGRSSVNADAEINTVNPATNEVVAIVKNGVNIIVDGLDNFGSIDVDTDNLVIWTEGGLERGAEGQTMLLGDTGSKAALSGRRDKRRMLEVATWRE